MLGPPCCVKSYDLLTVQLPELAAPLQVGMLTCTKWQCCTCCRSAACAEHMLLARTCWHGVLPEPAWAAAGSPHASRHGRAAHALACAPHACRQDLGRVMGGH